MRCRKSFSVRIQIFLFYRWIALVLISETFFSNPNLLWNHKVNHESSHWGYKLYKISMTWSVTMWRQDRIWFEFFFDEVNIMGGFGHEHGLGAKCFDLKKSIIFIFCAPFCENMKTYIIRYIHPLYKYKIEQGLELWANQK